MDQALSGSSVTSLDITGEPSLEPLLHPQQLTVPFRNQSSVHGFHNDPQITIFSSDSLQSSRLHTRHSELSRGWHPPTSICRSIPFPYRRSPTISVETLGSCHSLLFFFQNAHTSGLPNPKDTPPLRMYSLSSIPRAIRLSSYCPTNARLLSSTNLLTRYSGFPGHCHRDNQFRLRPPTCAHRTDFQGMKDPALHLCSFLPSTVFKNSFSSGAAPRSSPRSASRLRAAVRLKLNEIGAVEGPAGRETPSSDSAISLLFPGPRAACWEI